MRKNKKFRVELEDGEKKYTSIDAFQSRYGYVVRSEIINKYLKRKNFMIIDSSNNETLAEYVNFYYYPGWFERAFIYKYLGYSASRCEIQSQDTKKFIASVLQEKSYQLGD